MGYGMNSPAATSANRPSASRLRDTLKIASHDTKNVPKPSSSRPVPQGSVIVKRTDTRGSVPQPSGNPLARSPVGKTLAGRPAAKLPSTSSTVPTTPPPSKAAEPLVRSNGLWFEDGGSGKAYTALYSRLDQETFRGYPCLENNLVGGDFNVPEESIKRIDEQLTQQPPRTPCVNLNPKGQPHMLPYVDTQANFRQYSNKLKAGVAIQHIYMSILRRENALQGITPFAYGPEKTREWTLYIGDLIDSMNMPLLQKLGIGFVVSIHPTDFRCRGQHEKLQTAGIKHLSCQLDDSKGADMLSNLGGLIARINNHTSSVLDPKKRSVLVHCVAGLSRSVNVALGWAQKEYYDKTLKNSTTVVTAKAKYDALNQERTNVFNDLKAKRPGVKCDNFKAQLERHAAQMAGYQGPGAPAPPVTAQPIKASEEHGGGGYLKEAVVWFYYIYHLRPSATVLQFGRERIDKSKGSNNALKAYLQPWCAACAAKLKAGTISSKGKGSM